MQADISPTHRVVVGDGEWGCCLASGFAPQTHLGLRTALCSLTASRHWDAQFSAGIGVSRLTEAFILTLPASGNISKSSLIKGFWLGTPNSQPQPQEEGITHIL